MNQLFKENGFLVVNQICDVTDLKEYLPEKSGQFNFVGTNGEYMYSPEEEQVPGSTARYLYPKYRYAHSQVRLILENILGVELYNTYYFDRFYRAGQELKKHRDRDACEISLSLQISTNAHNPWEFKLTSLKGDNIAVALEDGCGIIYAGCDVTHWRDPLQSRYNLAERSLNKIRGKADDTYHHQIFFHYVLANGHRAHCYLDR